MNGDDDDDDNSSSNRFTQYWSLELAEELVSSSLQSLQSKGTTSELPGGPKSERKACFEDPLISKLLKPTPEIVSMVYLGA